MKGFKRYLRKTKCNCRVCLTGRYVKDKYGEVACEFWFNAGFDAEMDLHAKCIPEEEYERFYDKNWLKNKLER